MNWQKGDTIRLVFHASVKKFNRDEIQAVRSVIDKYRDYQVEYAFLKISENHGLHMFDAASANEDKGRFAPPRGKFLNLSNYETLVYLTGQRELRQVSDGHPRGVASEHSQGLYIQRHQVPQDTALQFLIAFMAQLFSEPDACHDQLL